MKYYKNQNNELFVDPIVENHVGLVEITKAEFDAQLEINNAPTPEQQLEQDKAEARAYLIKTDFMTLREAEGGEPMPADVKAQRAEYRVLLDGSLNL